MSKFSFGLALIIVALVGFFSFQKSLTVTRIIDGDTIELSDGRHIRYFGINSPEENQCYAAEAADLNEQLVLNKKVKLELGPNEIDQFGRTLAYVWVDGQMVNQKLLAEGTGEFYLDKVNIKYQEDLIQAANQAHHSGSGLLSECAEDKAAGCIVKGNMDKSGHRWYHLPGFKQYEATVVNLGHADRWFCSEKEAIEAGFEKARQ